MDSGVIVAVYHKDRARSTKGAALYFFAHGCSIFFAHEKNQSTIPTKPHTVRATGTKQQQKK
jgi:hypothetical protein